MNKFQDILKTLDPSIINEDTATAITTAFEESVNEKVNDRVKLEIESATSKIDEDHAVKLEKLLEAIDTDHSIKLEKVVASIYEGTAKKMENVVEFYKKALNEKADSFSSGVVDKISKFLDLYLTESIPTVQLEKAVANTYAVEQLAKIRGIVSVDPSQLNENVKNIVKTGKSKIDELQKQLDEQVTKNQTLLEEVNKTKTAIILEKETKGMSLSKKKFIFNLLNDKTPSYIKENFNFVVEMFEREDEEEISDLAEEAKGKAVSRDAKVSSVISESDESLNNTYGGSESPQIGGYLSELDRVR